MAPRLVDLEETLARDADGSARIGLIQRLQSVNSELRARLARGGTPEQYSRWSASARAVEAAISVLAAVKIEPAGESLAGPAVTLKGD